MSDFVNNPNINQRRAANPKKSVWVAASAGSGKTKVLSDRVLNLLLDGNSPEKILCLTFTKAAAAQMANRVAKRLGEWSIMPEDKLKKELFNLMGQEVSDKKIKLARCLFARVLDTYGGMKIFTIHGFCQSLLKRFPLEAGVSPNFKVMDDVDAKICMEETITKAISSNKMREDIEMISLYMEENDFADILKRLDADRGKIRKVIDKFGSVDGVINEIYTKLGTDKTKTKENFVKQIIENASSFKEDIPYLLKGKKTDCKFADVIGDFLQKSEEEKQNCFKDYLFLFLTKDASKIRDKSPTQSCADLKPKVQKEAERLYELYQEIKNLEVARLNEALFRISAFILNEYEATKKYKGLLDYSDLILKAEALLYKPSGVEWVLYKLDGGIDHILVDEAQDTSPEQWSIVRALAGDFFAGESAKTNERTIFAVGDKKQSIYSFQGADPDEFMRNKDYFANKIADAQKELDVVPLDFSFRSAVPVLSFTDGVFNSTLAKLGVLETGEKLHHIPFREDVAGLVEFWPFIEPEASDEPIAWSPPIERFLHSSPQARVASMIADKIANMINNKELLESEGRPIQAKDIMILLKNRNVIFAELVRALKARNIPVTGLDRIKMSEQIAVMDLVVLGEFLLLPDDDLVLATLLKTPFFSFDDDDLFELSYKRGTKSLWDVLRKKAETSEKYKNALDKLLMLLDMEGKVLPYDLYAFLLSSLGGRKALLSRLGLEAEDVIDEFMNLALTYEKNNAPSLQGFLAWIKAGNVEISRDLEQGEVDAVRITTVHNSKGLEAPIIFLPDTCRAGISSKDKIVWLKDEIKDVKIPLWLSSTGMCSNSLLELKDIAKQKMEEESHRLLYVALTRPRDRLYITGWRKKKSSANWYDILDLALTEDSLFNIEKENIKGIGLVRKIKSLQKNKVETKPLQIKEDIVTLPDWAFTKAKDELIPPRPLSPSKFAEDDVVYSPPFTLVREKAIKRGNLVHFLLQALPDLKKSERENCLDRVLTKAKIDFSDEELAKIKTDVLNVLNNPDFAFLFGENAKAEVPVSGMLDNKIFLGQIDRIAITPDEVLIVDYKTNQKPPLELGEVPLVYKTQLDIYKKMLAKLFKDKKVRAFLLWVDNMKMMEI